MYISTLSLAFLTALCSPSLAQSSSQPKPVSRNLTTIDIPTDAGTQRVSYFEVEGHAIIHGDIVYSTVKDLEQNRDTQKRSFSVWKNQTSRLWPGAQIEYKWQSEDAKRMGRLEAWTGAIKRWQNMMPFLEFVEHPASDAWVPNVTTIAPTTGQGACCSPIGMGEYQIFLFDSSCVVGTITHELGHLLGLYHEHQRPDRDNYITVNCSNVLDYPAGTPADCSENCVGNGCQFNKFPIGLNNASGPYDSLSIMHYGQWEFEKYLWSPPTIIMKPGVPAPPYWAQTFPTALDGQRVCDLYSDECLGVCGNGVLETKNGEECDDGNNQDGDGCSADCKLESTTSSSSLPPPSLTSSLPPTPPSSTPSTSPSS